MTADTALPIACARCSSLLQRGTTTCRVCQWDATAPVETPPAVHATEPSTPAIAAPAPVTAEALTYRGQVRRAAAAGRAAAVLAWLTCVCTASVFVAALVVRPTGAPTGAEKLLDRSAPASTGSASLRELASVDHLAALQVVVGLLALAATVVWTLRARRACVTRDTYPQRFSPVGVAVGWLVPVVSLVVPVKVVCDIWHGSRPEGPGRRPTTPAVVVAWWASLILAVVLASAARPRHGEASVVLLVATLVLECAAAASFVNILTRVRDWQQGTADAA